MCGFEALQGVRLDMQNDTYLLHVREEKKTVGPYENINKNKYRKVGRKVMILFANQQDLKREICVRSSYWG